MNLKGIYFFQTSLNMSHENSKKRNENNTQRFFITPLLRFDRVATIGFRLLNLVLFEETK